MINLNGFDWTVLASDAIGKHVLRGQIWEPHLVSFMTHFLKEGNICVDVVACFGWHTLHMSQLVGSTGTVYAFEPQTGNYNLLQKNITDNKIKHTALNNINTIKSALGHKKMTSCICSAYNPGEENWGDGFVSPSMESVDINKEEYIGRIGQKISLKLNKEIIDCTTMDSIIFGGPIDFIKIDVQGFEKMVLDGGVETIKRDRPVMVIEVENPCLHQFGYSSRELFNTIRNMGYYIFLLYNEYPCDHVCVPFEKLSDFEKQFSSYIHPHTENNQLTENVINGVDRKVVV
jgi:FkbM family methyltransferase